MPRGRKKLTPEERLEQITEQIEDYTDLLKELKDEKKQIEQEIQNQQIAELYDIVQSSGKSMEEVKAILYEQ